MYKASLYAFHLIYFATFSVSTFFSRYFAEIGITDAQIGILLSVPAMVGVLTQPYFGLLTDRVRLKKYVMIALLGALTAVCLLLDRLTGFAALMVGMTVYSILQLPVAPAYSTVSLEYTVQEKISYGPIRLLGTVGFQLGALILGALLVESLRGLFVLLAVLMFLSGAVSCFLPPVRGHQHGREKVSLKELFKDSRLMWLLALVLIGTTTNQFYLAFFSKHMGDIGIDNMTTGLLLILSALVELPFLVFGDRLARKTSVWNWALIGFILCAIRWIGLAVSRTVVPLVLSQLPGFAVMACFEFFPALYINERAPAALKSSAQNALMIVAFGISKVIGSLLGGFVVELVGIPWVFAGNGIMLLAAAAMLYGPTRKMHREDTAPAL